MDVLALLVLAPVIFLIGQFVAKKIKIAPPIFYLLLGVLFGGSVGIVHIFGNDDLLPNMANYNTIALWLMFFGAGFNIDMKKILKSGKDTINLAVLPVVVEAVIMIGLATLALSILPLGFDLSIPQIAVVMLLFAMASPANVIPACMGYNMTGYAGKNRITDSMIIASIFDNFTPLPLAVVALVFTVAPAMKMKLTPLLLVGIVVGVVIALGVICLIASIVGKVVAKILSPISDKVASDLKNKKMSMIYTLIYFIVFALILNFSGPIKSLAVLVIVSVSVGINQKEKNGLGSVIGMNASMLFAMFGSPIIFIYVGSLINIQTLLNPIMLAFGVGITFIAIAIKGLVTKFVLRDDKYTDGERKFAMSAFVPKGIILVNFSLILMGPLKSIGMGYVIDFMILLAAISIVVSVPLGVTLMDKARDKWLVKEDNNHAKAS